MQHNYILLVPKPTPFYIFLFYYYWGSYWPLSTTFNILSLQPFRREKRWISDWNDNGIFWIINRGFCIFNNIPNESS